MLENIWLEDQKKSDIKSVFSGLRPLAAPKDKNEPTKEISRHHKILVSESGLVSALGGKWITYRKMSEDIIDTAIPIAGLPERNCITQNLPIHGFDFNSNWSDPLHVYGTDIEKIKKIDSYKFNKSLSKKIYNTKYIIVPVIEDFINNDNGMIKNEETEENWL